MTLSNSKQTRSFAAMKWGSLARIIAVSLGGILILRMFVISLYLVPSASMEPTIQRGDYVLVWTLEQSLATSYDAVCNWFGTQNGSTRSIFVPRGSVIAFELPKKVLTRADGSLFVKRVAGCPGDTLFVNSKGIKRGVDAMTSFAEQDTAKTQHDFEGLVFVPYKGEHIELSAETVERWRSVIVSEGNTLTVRQGIVYVNSNSTPQYVLQHNYYYVLGDNSGDSYDSRFWGFVQDNDIIGTPVFVYWSSELDDNNNSVNTRFDRIGTVIR